MSGRRELYARPYWHETGDAYFPVAAKVGDHWWVLRINSFPDHPLWTLFVNGERRFDIDDLPSSWRKIFGRPRLVLNPVTVGEALAPVQDLVAYGSEVGQPCDGLFCCS